jgi:hypothetical protein
MSRRDGPSEIESFEFASLSPANTIRQRLRYSIGHVQTSSRNLTANAARDVPTRHPVEHFNSFALFAPMDVPASSDVPGRY